MEMIELTTVTLDVRPMRRGSEKSVVEGVLGREPGVHRVEANPVAQTATVSYDPAQTSLGALRLAVERCGYHCAGLSVPAHFCDAVAEPGDLHAGRSSAHPAEVVASKEQHEHAGHGRPVDYATSTGGPSSVRRTR